MSLLTAGALDTLCTLAEAAPPGRFAEVGVYQGGSAARLLAIARRQGRELHLFDTFAGIPLRGPLDTHQIGDFSDVNLDAVRAALPGAYFHVGVFPRTLPAALNGLAFVHVDCDQYESVRACAKHLYPLLVPGGVMLFDDYLCLDGATRAVNECFPDGVQLTRERKAWVVRPALGSPATAPA